MDFPYMVIDKAPVQSGLTVGSRLANGMIWGGSAHAIFQTKREAMEWQMAKGKRATTEIVKW